MNPFNEKSINLLSSFQNWKQLYPKQYNKYDAIMDYAKRNGYSRDEIIFFGDDFGDGGGDSHVRIKGMDYIFVKDYKKFPEYAEILLK